MKDKLSDFFTKDAFLKELQDALGVAAPGDAMLVSPLWKDLKDFQRYNALDTASPGGDATVISTWKDLRYDREYATPDIYKRKYLPDPFIFDLETYDDVGALTYGRSALRGGTSGSLAYTRERTYAPNPTKCDYDLISHHKACTASLNDLSRSFDKSALMSYYYGRNNGAFVNDGVSKGARNNRTILLLSPDRSRTEMHDSLSALDLVGVGWTRVDSLACEACHGVGTIEGEVCWHCEGAKLDPVLTEDLA